MIDPSSSWVMSYQKEQDGFVGTKDPFFVFTMTTEKKFESSRKHHTPILQISERADSVRGFKDLAAVIILAFHPDL